MPTSQNVLEAQLFKLPVYTAVKFVTASISIANAGYIGSGPQPRAYTYTAPLLFLSTLSLYRKPNTYVLRNI